MATAYEIQFFNARVETGVITLPKTLLARFFALADRMEQYGPNLREPHTQSMGNGLYEMRLKGAEGIARVFYCAIVDRRIVMLHCFVKKTQKTPRKKLETARRRLKEVQDGNV
ncbi:type II toxin-antitoxin system RelE/ParE family toxin [Burkholderia sp. Bp9017]|uniref:Type II toxin-antitoxin system RelE/ParE family toxin n=1 Tax=Burkholderia anthina TaxID=179879 RepID=A0A7T6VMN7_9BURK|nr:type II toxin-antitoxin system RelE/ParE family toxin [Burkholderia anthina]QQK06727.1 type II toxin-antitoxin system RelE/ParE family toxin [Burkholderia anthina]RQZ22992.1 type II toxin-antitoxin system RelE/ParE family toxin [Burkholderia sp. Bp9017]RQZ30583.1 type II toxin-antitoxin system RelE/ParE family toxin [Burkholderia sp. Bp9016]